MSVLRDEASASSAGETGVTLKLLGSFELAIAGEPYDLPLTVQRLIAFLALHHGDSTPLPRTFVASSLWFHGPESHAQTNLRGALWRLRRTDLPVLDVTPTHVQLHRGVWIDALAQWAVATEVRPCSDVRAPVYIDALLTPELLLGWYDEWVLNAREQLNEACTNALEQAAKGAIERGQLGDAVRAALAAVHRDPLRESAAQLLIAAYLDEGNVAAAVAHYERYRRLLWGRLRLRPSPRLTTILAEAGLSP